MPPEHAPRRPRAWPQARNPSPARALEFVFVLARLQLDVKGPARELVCLLVGDRLVGDRHVAELSVDQPTEGVVLAGVHVGGSEVVLLQGLYIRRREVVLELGRCKRRGRLGHRIVHDGRNHPVLPARYVQGPDHREGGEVHQLGLQAGLARNRQQVLDGVAAGAHDDDAHRAALAVVDALQHAVVQHRLLERHRQLLLGLEADRCLELLLVVDRRQLEHAQRDLLAGDAEADALGKVVLAEEGLQTRRRGRRRRRPLPRGRGPGRGSSWPRAPGRGCRSLNSAAARKPGSMSSPTIERVFDSKSPIPCSLAGLGAWPGVSAPCTAGHGSDAPSIDGRRGSL